MPPSRESRSSAGQAGEAGKAGADGPDWAQDSPLEVAPRLLGAVLRHGGVGVRITEVEAYGGADDPGSHAYRGRTQRNAVMFGPAGRLYVYFTYGMHHCANLVTGPAGVPGAVLIRAGEVVEGHELARARRPSGPDRDLARGPARLCRALALDLDVNGSVAALDGVHPGSGRGVEVARGPRVGLRQAADRPWRLWIAGEPTVSRYVAARPTRVERAGPVGPRDRQGP